MPRQNYGQTGQGSAQVGRKCVRMYVGGGGGGGGCEVMNGYQLSGGNEKSACCRKGGSMCLQDHKKAGAILSSTFESHTTKSFASGRREDVSGGENILPTVRLCRCTQRDWGGGDAFGVGKRSEPSTGSEMMMNARQNRPPERRNASP